MIQGIRRLASIDTEHNLQHETLARNSMGFIGQIATASGDITQNSLPNNYMQFYQVHSETRLAMNVNNSIFSFKAEDLPRNTYEKIAITGGDTTAGYLNDKVLLGRGLSSVVNNSGANETLSLTCTITGQKSIESDAATLQLVGDVATPSASNVYGADSGGIRGWKPDTVASFYIGTFTRVLSEASGTQAITGVGFQPTHVIFKMVQTSSAEPMRSDGFDDGTKSYCQYVDNTDDLPRMSTSFSIYWFNAAGTSEYKGEISALGADGFTINWTKVGSPTPTITIIYMAFKP